MAESDDFSLAPVAQDLDLHRLIARRHLEQLRTIRRPGPIAIRLNRAARRRQAKKR